MPSKSLVGLVRTTLGLTRDLPKRLCISEDSEARGRGGRCRWVQGHQQHQGSLDNRRVVGGHTDLRIDSGSSPDVELLTVDSLKRL